jgi:hypothetical protein
VRSQNARVASDLFLPDVRLISRGIFLRQLRHLLEYIVGSGIGRMCQCVGKPEMLIQSHLTDERARSSRGSKARVELSLSCNAGEKETDQSEPQEISGKAADTIGNMEKKGGAA